MIIKLLRQHARIWFVALLTVLVSHSHSLAQPTSDSLELRVEPEFFSPNEDGIQDQAFFSPVLISQSDVTRWRLVIRTAKRKKVQRITGAGFSALINWDGKGKKGAVVPEGDYFCSMTVWGKGLRLTSPTKMVVVDNSPPLVEMSVSTSVLDQSVPGQEFLTFVPHIVDTSPLDRWQLQILDLTGRTVFVYWSTGSVKEVVWDGTDSTSLVMAPQGVYRCALQAWDKAGNESAPAFLDVVVNVTAREMLERVLDKITVVETDLGLLVQIPAKDLFTFKKKKPIKRPHADILLREVALLVNAYPEVLVLLDGYSRQMKSANKDRDRASRYAWTVYSYLVKKGNVKASRLTVRGRGRSPMFERRAVDLPILKNGVEILLEGDREW